MEDYFRAICAFGVGYERVKGYEFDTPEASRVNEARSKKDPGPHFTVSGPHFQNACTKYTNQASNRFVSTSSPRQSYRGNK